MSVAKILRLFQLLLEEKEIDIQLHNPDPDLQAWGDKNMFEFVLRNLIHNALKFTPKKGSISIDVRQDGEFLSLNVTDSGVGMKQTEIERILTLGEAFTKTGTEKEQGSGIGLLMCKDFIERNGGELMISSSKIGTCVSFQIPAYESTSVKLDDAG
jgi:signal transduction histidine kinase